MSRSYAKALVLVFILSSCILFGLQSPSFAEVAEDSWVPKAPMQVARAYLGVAVVKAKIYAIGGADPPEWVQAVGTNEEYDPTIDTWTLRAPMPTNRSQFGIVVYQNKIYCIGGVYGNAVYSNGVFSYFDVYEVAANEVYDPATNTWENKAPLPDSRAGVSALLVDGKIYVLGGNSSANDVYDPATDTWTTKAPIPIGLYEYGWWTCCSAVVGNKIHVVGLGVNVHFHLIYDPESDSWSSGALWPPGAIYSSAGATTGAMAPGRMYVFGVDSLMWDLGLPGFATLVYSPENNSWTTGTSMPTGRISVGVAIVNDTFYVIGGSTLEIGNNRHASGANEQYIPVGYFGSVDVKAPHVTVLSPENKTYYSTDISLSFNVDEAISRASYSLDAQDPIATAGNVTLIALSYGVHNLTVYATDMSGNTAASETVHFVISEEQPTFAWVVPVVIGAVLATGLLVYFMKVKKKPD